MMKRTFLALAALALTVLGEVSAVAQSQYIAPYPGAVGRTNNSKMSDIISVLDFGVDKTGVTNAVPKLTTMQAQIPASSAILFPPGTYRLTTSVAMTGHIIYANGATFVGTGSITGATFNTYPTAITQPATDNSTLIATTAFVQSAIASSVTSCTPFWLPCPQGISPIVYADFVNGRYWFNGATYATYSTWLTAVTGTFTRSVASNYTASNGFLASAAINTARFDYDPQTGAALGIYLEPTFNNSILRSQTFANAAWTKTNVAATDNSVLAPDNTMTGALLTENGAGTVAHEVLQSMAQNQAAVSVYARAGTGSYLNIAVDDGNNGEYFQAICDLSQGGISEYSTASTGTGINTISLMLVEPAPDFGDGWYRCALSGTFAAPTGTVNIHIGLAPFAHGNTYNNRGAATYVSGGKTAYVWGAQVPSAPNNFFSYVATTAAPVSGGGDILTIGSGWDNAANSLSFAIQYDVRGTTSLQGSTAVANGYYAGPTDVFYIDAPAPKAYHYPSGNATASQLTSTVPGVTTDAIRQDSFSITLSSNGGPISTSSNGAARTAATSIRLCGYQTSASNATACRLRTMAAWSSGVANGSLVSLSQTSGTPVVTLASTVETAAGAGNKFVDFPAFVPMPSSCLLATYMKSNTAGQDAAPTVPTYKTAMPATALNGGAWSAAATAVPNSTPNIVVQLAGLAALNDGSILGTITRYNNSTLAYALQTVTATETSQCTVSWGTATTITGSPFFTGVSGVGPGNFFGDATVSPARQLASGDWMILLYGYLPGDANSSLGAIFSTTPANPASWGNFTIIARGNTFTPARDFTEANFMQAPNGDVVVFLRQDAVITAGSQDYWRVVCPNGADCKVAANWRAPTFLAFSAQIGMPDVTNLGNNGVMLWTRQAQGTNQLIGYNVNWAAGASPFASQRAAYGASGVQYWYSQTQAMPANDGTYGTALGQEGASSSIVFIKSAISGIGQSQ